MGYDLNCCSDPKSIFCHFPEIQLVALEKGTVSTPMMGDGV